MIKNKLALIAIPSILVLGLTACNNGDIAEPDPSGPVLTDDPGAPETLPEEEPVASPGDVVTDDDGREYEVLSIGPVRNEGLSLESDLENFNRIDMSADRKSLEVRGSGSSSCLPSVIDAKQYLDDGLIELTIYEPGPAVMCTADIMPFEQTITRHDDSLFPEEYSITSVGSEGYTTDSTN